MTATVVPGTLYPARPGARRHPVIVACPLGDDDHWHLHFVALDADLAALHRRPKCAPRRVYRIDLAPAGVT
jgi:hypothetical protein